MQNNNFLESSFRICLEVLNNHKVFFFTFCDNEFSLNEFAFTFDQRNIKALRLFFYCT